MKIFYFILTLFITSTALSEIGWVGSLMERIPGSAADGIRDYLKIIGVKPDRAKNSDIRSYNTDLVKKNECIRSLATNFYSSITDQGIAIELSASNLKKPLPRAVSLSETAKDSGLKPGWLWQKALEYANGNKSLALQIIGLCGHDDMYQMNGYFFPLTQSQQKDLKDAAAKISKESKDILISKITKSYLSSFFSPSEDRKKEIAKQAEKDFEEGVSFNRGLLCPGGRNPMFYPQALAETADIPVELKQKIAKIQSPSKGAEYLPAKSYHVMGAAYLSCVMLRKGVPEVIAKELALNAVQVYRATTLCSVISDLNRKIIRASMTIAEALEIIKQKRSKNIECNGFSSEQIRHDCQAIQDVLGTNIIKDNAISDDILALKIKRSFARSDASKMFFNSWRSAMSNKCEGIQLTNSLKNYLQKYGSRGSDNPCEKGLSQERCEAARTTMDEWAVDFEWSEAAHLAGFNFAKANCDPIESNSDLETQACAAIKKSQKIAPSTLQKGDGGKTSSDRATN